MSVTLHRMKNLGPRITDIMNTFYSRIQAPRPNGLKRFEIGEQSVWALNKRNAERKAKLYPGQEVIGG